MIDVVQLSGSAVNVVQLSSGNITATMALTGVVDVVTGANGPRGSTGEQGPPGQDGADGEAMIPEVLDGGNF